MFTDVDPDVPLHLSLDERIDWVQKQQNRENPFHFNALHDLESLFWIMVYYTINKDVYLTPDTDQAVSLQVLHKFTEGPERRRSRLRTQRSHAMSLFFAAGIQRSEVLSIPNTLSLISQSLHTILLVCRIPHFTITLRNGLVHRYQTVERDISRITKDCAEGLYEEMVATFGEAVDALQSINVLVKIRSLSQEELYSHHPSLSTLSSIQSVDTSGPIPLPRGSSVPTKRKRLTSLHAPLPRLPDRARGVASGQGAGSPLPHSPDAEGRPNKAPRLSDSSHRRSPRFPEGQFAIPSIPPFRHGAVTRSVASSSARPAAGPSSSSKSGSKKGGGRRRQ